MASIRKLDGPQRALATHARSPGHYEAVVVGAGPAGVTCVGNLLERKLTPILWIDDGFDGGRVNRNYREVPSNTKVKFFVDFATALTPFRKLVSGTPSRARWEEPSASDSVDASPRSDKLDFLRQMDQESGCRLSHAADMILLLTEGLKRTPGVETRTARVTDATLDDRTHDWNVRWDADGVASHATAKRLVMCTGASPRDDPLPVSIPGLQTLDLDTALSPTKLHVHLSSATSPSHPTTVAVIGASHSAILVLMNLSQLASSNPSLHLKIKWFTRHPLRYAVFMDGWILRDNTGLKGEAAAWAKANLEPEVFASSDVAKFIEPISYDAGAESSVFAEHLPGSQFVVQAIGYQRDALPTLKTSNGTLMKPDFDHETGGFSYAQEMTTGEGQVVQTPVPGLYGAGIAFPEKVKDPHGNVEMAVGFFKFMKFVKRVSPQWN